MLTYTVMIDEYQTIDDKVYYQININCLEGHRKISKRYSDLKALNDKIIEKNSNFKLHLNLPQFPGRKIFGRTKNSVAGIKQRGKELQKYLEEVLNIKQLQSFQSIKELLPHQQLYQETLQLTRSGEYDKEVCWLQMDELKRSFLERQENKTPKNNKSKSKSSFNTTGYVQRYHFSIDDYEIQQDVVLYTITLTDAKKTTNYQFTSRYSDLREYHKLLKKENLKVVLPDYPKRKIISQTNENPLFIQERLEQLQKYLNDIFAIKELVQSEPLQYFITRIKLEGKPIRVGPVQQKQQICTSSVLYESQENLPERKSSF
ncbi:unnamed protein product (macronuclear) [Paramecium tetraurelia]|uniref:PX domain-containing protein n=1 Tax=Paramecium tetraurelia TaxID=5888 RepID=A0BYK0_PARTE|nr:uncharacterized protein GSPATT00033470001 [Paramecium tetraurelia]CAK63617.1 unnamed protein product [Paramecium tetraurelia]|eukprot:XP_001431015.1 hypothetical protein (macronuclear) [Paramecium tetraurelia strain d4-2]